MIRQDGNSIQDRQTKRGKEMDRQSTGKIKEYTLGHIRIITEGKGSIMSCKKISLTHSSMSSMINTGMR